MTKMKKTKISAALCCIITAASLTACGPAKLATVKVIPALPNQTQADSLMLALTGQSTSLNFPLQFDENPRVYGFLPDSSTITIFTLRPDNGVWAKESEASYPCFDSEGMTFKSFTDSSSLRTFEGKRFITFNTVHENGKEASKSFVLYNPDTENLSSLSLTGKRLPDGRIEGSSNKNLIEGASSPEIKWALDQMASDPTLIELSESELKTIQALEWWEGKNPNALKNATKITFGQLPEDCTLVESFKTSGKEKSSKFIVAQFSVRGRNVIVAQRRSNGEYILVWAEPVKYNGRTIENFYFDGDSVLSVLYYQGRKSFKHRINLSTMAISR